MSAHFFKWLPLFGTFLLSACSTTKVVVANSITPPPADVMLRSIRWKSDADVNLQTFQYSRGPGHMTTGDDSEARPAGQLLLADFKNRFIDELLKRLTISSHCPDATTVASDLIFKPLKVKIDSDGSIAIAVETLIRSDNKTVWAEIVETRAHGTNAFGHYDELLQNIGERFVNETSNIHFCRIPMNIKPGNDSRKVI